MQWLIFLLLLMGCEEKAQDVVPNTPEQQHSAPEIIIKYIREVKNNEREMLEV